MLPGGSGGPVASREGLTESPWHSLDETVAVMETIDEARRQVAAQARGVHSAARSRMRLPM